MKQRYFLCLLLFSVSTWADNQSQSAQPLNSDELQQIKKKYESCVFDNGALILKHSNLRDAIEFAPLACRKELLKAKKYLLDSAFKIDVIDQLVSSIEEGVKIDLAGQLVEQLKPAQRSN